MTLYAPQRQPSRWERIANGDRDHINGFDDGEPQREYRSGEPGDPATGNLDYETAEHKLNNNIN
jgi:hypothetical protein